MDGKHQAVAERVHVPALLPRFDQSDFRGQFQVGAAALQMERQRFPIRRGKPQLPLLLRGYEDFAPDKIVPRLLAFR